MSSKEPAQNLTRASRSVGSLPPAHKKTNDLISAQCRQDPAPNERDSEKSLTENRLPENRLEEIRKKVPFKPVKPVPGEDIPPIHEQLATRIRLAISEGKFRPGDELPSTREFAKAYGISRGTVTRALVGRGDDDKSSLKATGWIQTQQGGGTFVYNYIDDIDFKTQNDLDHAILEWLKSMTQQGYHLIEIESRMNRMIRQHQVARKISRPTHILVIEPENELRAIIKAEIKTAFKEAKIEFGVLELSLDDFVTFLERQKENQPHPRRAAPLRPFPVAHISHAKDLHDRVPKLRSYLLLNTTPEERLLEDWPSLLNEKVAIISKSEAFRKNGRDILVARGVGHRDIAVGSTWKDLGIDSNHTIFTDVVMAPSIPMGLRKNLRVVKIVADYFIRELLSHVKSFTSASKK